MTDLCNLARTLPVLVGSFLDSEEKLKRGRYREETLTDLFTSALTPFAGPELVIEYPHEASTGGDVDLEFWHVETGSVLSLRIQAKRLSSAKERGKSVDIRKRSYRELLHKVRGTGEYQFKRLIDASSTHFPLYMFYNHGAATQDVEFLGKSPSVKGINLAFATDIASLMDIELATRPRRLNYRRLFYLRPYFFDLEDIFCVPLNPGETVPTPHAVHEVLHRKLYRLTADFVPARARDRAEYLRAMGEIAPSIRTSGKWISDGAAIRVDRRLKRSRITFISGRTEDERTPRIFPRGFIPG